MPNNDFNILGLPFCGPVAQERESPDRSALEAFYHATDGDNWTEQHQLAERPACRRMVRRQHRRQWERDGLGPRQQPVERSIAVRTGEPLQPEGAHGSGTTSCAGRYLPELGSLSYLTELDLSGNQLSGSIPPELGSLSNLAHLGLSVNELSGSIPSELDSLSNLMGLYLNENELSGSIPSELGSLTGLESELYLNSNQLSGEIPSELGSLSNLHVPPEPAAGKQPVDRRDTGGARQPLQPEGPEPGQQPVEAGGDTDRAGQPIQPDNSVALGLVTS